MTTSARPIIFLAFANDRDDRARYLRNLAEEARRLREALERAERAGLCEVIVRQNATVQEIFDFFQDVQVRNRVAVFHYGGHANSYQLLFEGAEGQPAPADAAGLAAFLGHQRGLQLTFLNGCSTQGQAQGLLDAGVAVVVTTSQAIDDQVATEFAARFYTGLAGGASIGTAFGEAQAALRTAKGGLTRKIGAVAEEGRPVDDRLPWERHIRPGAEAALDWSLPEAANDPLYPLPPLPRLDLPPTPYRHLEWFRREDAEIFFGRGHEIAELYRRVTAADGSPIILFYGQSGVGKSSVLAAGLLPRLEGNYLVRYCRRNQSRGLSGTLEDALAPADIASLTDAWRTAEAEAGKPLVVVLDQVEELFTRRNPEQPDELERFLEVSAGLFADPSQRPQGRLILGFRKEWLAEIEKRLEERRLPRSRVFLERLSRLGIVEAVEGPARLPRLRDNYGLTVAPDLPGFIADDLLSDRESPVAPMLQILLTAMWKAAKSWNDDHPTFDQALYQEFSRKGLGLNDFLARQLQELHGKRAAAVESGLALDLLAYHTTPLGTAEQRTMADLEQTYRHQAETLAGLVQECRDLYLLVDPSQSQPNQPVASRLTHDTLAPHVRKRFDESDAPGQRARRILESRAVDWEEGELGTPLDDTDLTLVEAGAYGMRAWRGDEDRLMQASRQARQQRLAEVQKRKLEARNRRFLAFLALVILSLILSIAIVLWRNQRVTEFQLQQQSELLVTREAEAKVIAAAKGTAVSAQATEQVLRIAEAKARAKAQTSEQNALYASNIGLAYRFWTNGQIIQMNDALGASAPGKDESDLRGFEWRYLAHLANQDRLTLSRRPHDRIATAPFVGVGDVAYSPDGTLIVDVREDGVLTVWNAHTGEEQRTLVPHQYGTAVVMFVPGSSTRFLTVGSSDGAIKLWEARIGNMVRELTTGQAPVSWSEHMGTPFDAGISADGRTLVLLIEPGQGAIDGSFTTLMYLSWQVHIIDLDTGDATIWNDDSRSLAISPQGDRIAIGAGRRIFIKDRKTGEKKQEFDLTVDYAGKLAFSQDGKRLAIGGDSIQLWDIETGRQLTRLVGHRGGITALRFSSDDAVLASAGQDNTVILWNARDYTQQAVLRGHEQPINAIDFSPDNSQLLSGGADNYTKVWEVQAALRPEAMKSNSFVFAPEGTRMFAWDDFSLDGRVVANGMDRFGHVVDPTGWRFTIQGQGFSSYDGVLFSVDGRHLYTFPDIRVYDASTLRRLADLEGQAPAVFGDGQFMATHTNTELVVYQTTDWKVNRRLRTSKGEITTIAGQPALDLLAVGYKQGKVEVWDTANWTVKYEMTFDVKVADKNDPSISALRFSPDGEQLLALLADNRAVFFKVESGEKSFVFESVAGQSDSFNPPVVSFSPDGQWLSMLDSSGLRPRVWNAKTGELQATLLGHTSEVSSITISPDGRTVATGSNDTTIKLWNLATGQEMLTLETGLGRIISLGFAPDGSALVSTHWGDEYRSLKVWRTITDGELLFRAIQMTDQEQARSIVSMTLEGKTEALARAVSNFRDTHPDKWWGSLPPVRQVMVAVLMRHAQSAALAGDFAGTKALLELLTQQQPIDALPVVEQVRRYFSVIYDNSLALAESLLDTEVKSSLTQAELVIGGPIQLGLLKGSTSNLLNIYYLLAQADQQQGDMPSAADKMATYVRAQELSRGKPQPLVPDSPLTLSVTQGLVYYLPFQAKAGDRLDLQVASEDGVDPLIVLLGLNEVGLSFCDDISDYDRNARISDYPITETATHTLVVTHAGGGSEGTVTVMMRIRSEP